MSEVNASIYNKWTSNNLMISYPFHLQKCCNLIYLKINWLALSSVKIVVSAVILVATGTIKVFRIVKILV